MRYLLIGYIILLTTCRCWSQDISYFNTFNPVEVDQNEHLFTYQDAVQQGDAYYCLGSRLTTLNRQHTLTKLDKYGDTLWNRYYGDAPQVYMGLRLIAYASQLVAVGITKNGTDNSTHYDVDLMAFDYAGNVLWETRVEHPFDEVVYDVVKSEDGKLTIAGNTKSFGNTNQFTDGSSSNFYFLQTDSLGNLLWENYLDLPYQENCLGITALSDGGFMISGSGKRANEHSDILLVQIDDQGTILGNRYYGTVPGDEYGGKITELPDKTLLLSSTYVNNNALTIPRIYTLGMDGSVYRYHDYPDVGFSCLDFFSIAEEDGSVIFGGLYTNTGNNELSKIVRIAPNGETVYTRKYNSDLPDTPQYLVGASKVDDGYLLVGTTFDTNYVQRAWAIKTDCFLCDSNLCYFEDSACYYYDCMQYPTDAQFTASETTLDVSGDAEVHFQNTSANCTNRVWKLGDDTRVYGDSTFTHEFETPGDYEVELVTHNGVCSDTSKQVIHVLDSSLGLADNANATAGFRIYPNPSAGELNILLPEQGETYLIRLFDNTGRLLLVQRDNGNTIRVEGLGAGNYFVHVYQDGRFLGIQQAVVLH